MAALVLIVDDSPESRALARSALEGDGYEFAEVESSESALELLEVRDPAICIIDSMMPGMNGIELIERIRRLPGHAETPIVLFTARIDLETSTGAREAGAAHTFDKMVPARELRAKVRELVGGR